MTEPRLEELTLDDCLQLLEIGTVGRIAYTDGEYPVIFPVNYRLVETSGVPWIALRTRVAATSAGTPVPGAFEIDGHYDTRKEGWSVLVRGTLEPIDPETDGIREHFDPDPWVGEREAWLAMAPFSITGRRLLQEEPE